jgi:hypothetical protein
VAHRYRGLVDAALLGEFPSHLLRDRGRGEVTRKLSLPVALTVFPGEIFQGPRSWAEKVYPNLSYFNEVDWGGHFAAWEKPQVFSHRERRTGAHATSRAI